MKFEFGKYRSQILISLKFLSKNKDNELSAEKSKSYKYLMDKSVAKELVMDIEYHNRFENKDPIFVIENAGGYNYRGNEVAIESIELFTEDKYFRTKCPNPIGLVYLTKAKTVAGNSPIKCKITVDGLDEHELEIIEHFNREQKNKSIYVKDTSSTLKITDSIISLLDNKGSGIAYGTSGTGTTVSIANSLQGATSTCKDCAEAIKQLTSVINDANLKTGNENKNDNIDYKERGNNMFKNVMKDFYCGPAKDVKMSIYGPAFKAISEGGERPSETYVTYHDSEYIDVMDGVIDIGDCAYVMPVAVKSVKKGDFIKHCGTWIRVTSIKEGVIEGESVYTRNIIKIRPTKNMFGFNFYSKLITFDIMNGTSEDNPFGNILPMLLLGDGSSNKMKDILPLMMMINKDFDMSNPMMMYFLMNREGGDNNLLPIMMMGQFMNKKNEEEEE